MERVCFIRPEYDGGPVLIVAGPTPTQLLAVAQLGNPARLALMGSVDGQLYPESWWHDTLAPWRLRGAWYQPKAQVLCTIEDALSGRLEPPKRLDPIMDPLDPSEASEDGSEVLDRVPEDIRRPLVKKSLKQAITDRPFPEVDPYSPVEPQIVPPKKVLPILRKLLQTAA
jgi:hypothetical protein